MNKIECEEEKTGITYSVYRGSKEEIQEIRDNECVVKLPDDGFMEVIKAHGGTEEDYILYRDGEAKGGRVGVVEENVAKRIAATIGEILIERGEWTQEDADDYIENGMDDSEEEPE